VSIPSLQNILDGYKLGEHSADQCKAWIEEKVRRAAPPVTVNIPALDRLVTLLEKMAEADAKAGRR
jgi:hypothetical protein